MKKCKWAGDPADEYCKSCDGCKMMVDGIEKSCTECNGYEAGDEDIADDNNEETKDDTSQAQEKTQKEEKKEKTTNTTSKKEKAENEANTKSKKVAEEHTATEITEDNIEGIKITALRYSSSVTIKRGDNYYKFSAEEEWDVANYKSDIQDARDILWAKLNVEVDRQIDELNQMD